MTQPNEVIVQKVEELCAEICADTNVVITQTGRNKMIALYTEAYQQGKKDGRNEINDFDEPHV